MFAVDHRGTVVGADAGSRCVFTAEPLGRPADEVLDARLAEYVREVVALATVDSGEERRLDVPDPDGRLLRLAIRALPLVLAGGDPVWVFLLRDTGSDVEAASARTIDSLRSDFFLGLIHDMKTPVTGIINGCDLLGAATTALGEDEVEILRIVQASAERLHALVTEVLEMSALESESLENAMEVVDLAAVVGETVEPLTLQSSKHRIELHRPEGPVPVVCQPRRIARVIENLVANAIKYSPCGGDVAVAVCRNGAMAAISVTDQGVGIAGSEISRIWDRFQRGHLPGGLAVDGNGLGLSIAKMIVERHRGRVSVESEHGRGSKFTVEIPLAATPQPSEATV